MKALRQVLALRTEEELEQLVRLWGISDKPADGWQNHTGRLVQSMQDPVCARFVWEQLSPIERKLLHTSLTFAISDAMLEDFLLKSSRLSVEEFVPALEKLKQDMLLLEEQIKVKSAKPVATGKDGKTQKAPAEIITRVYVPRDIVDILKSIDREIHTPKQDRSTFKLDQILASLSIDQVYAIGQRYGFMLHDYYYQSDPRTRLRGQLVQPDVPFYAWEQLEQPTRKLCKWLIEQGGAANMATIREQLGFDNPTLAKSIHQLQDYALAFDTFVEHERRLFIPHEYHKSLKKAVEQLEVGEEPVEVGLFEMNAQPTEMKQAEPFVLYDLATIIGAAFQQNIELTQGGYIPKRISNKIAPQVQITPRIQSYQDDEFTVDMLFNIAEHLGLLKLVRSSADSTKRRYEEGPELRSWSQKSMTGMATTLLEQWIEGQVWTDIAGAHYDPYSSGGMYYYLNYASGRKTLVDYLNSCTPGRWYSLSSLLHTLRHEEPFSLRSKHEYAGISGARNTRSTLAGWYKVDGEIYTGILTSLYEMGLVSLGYEEREKEGEPRNPSAFMLTELGEQVISYAKRGIGQQETEQYASGKTLIVQPNFELLLLQPDMPTLYSLLPFAQVNQVGRVSRLTLTKNSLLRGLEMGRNIDQILRTLEEHSQKELPQNVLYTLNDWARNYKEVHITQVFLVEAPSESMANDMALSEKLKSFGLRRLGPCVFAVSNDVNVQDLRRVLEKESIVARVAGDIITRSPYSTTTFGRRR